jgi:glutamine transport system substrate-binding protein
MFQKKIALVMAALLMLALAIGAAGCGGAKQQTAAPAKELRVVSDTTYPPFEFQDEQSKEYVGFDIDLVKAIAKQMGVTVKIESSSFDGIIPALQANQADMAVSAMSINEERKEKIGFSAPYYKSGLIIAVKATNNSITSAKDLEGKSIAVQIGTTGAIEAKKIKDAKVSEFNTNNEAFLEMKNGGADAEIDDQPVTAYAIAKGHPDVKMVGELMSAEDYGIAFNKNNTELIANVNKALDEIKKNGEYDKIYEKWFGKKSVR